MTHRYELKTLAAACLIVGASVIPLRADPAKPTPIATEQFSGTILSLTPQITYQGAVLRVSGPGDYALTKRFAPGETITADLLTETEPRESAGAVGAGRRGAPGGFLSDGKYRYEVVLRDDSGQLRRHAGLSFVRGGSLLSRASVRGDLKQARRSLAADLPEISEEDVALESLLIVDADENGSAFLSLDMQVYGSIYENWSLLNLNGDLHIAECPDYSHPYPYGGCERYTMTFPHNSGGRVGIGTGAPLEELHINSSDGADIRLTGSGADWVVGILASSNQFILRDASNNASIVRLDQGAPANSLVIDADGRVGIAAGSGPEGDFHLGNADGAGDSVFKIARSGTGSWNLGHTATGVFTFNKTGSGGQEFTVRNRNHAVATLDVQGHVRGTSFKSSSSRALKTEFEAVDSSEVLHRVSELPVTSWRYTNEPDGPSHIGPVAEDFQRLFGLGDGETISNVDAVGVLLAAVQGLKVELEQKDQTISDLNARVVALEARSAFRESSASANQLQTTTEGDR